LLRKHNKRALLTLRCAASQLWYAFAAYPPFCWHFAAQRVFSSLLAATRARRASPRMAARKAALAFRISRALPSYRLRSDQLFCAYGSWRARLALCARAPFHLLHLCKTALRTLAAHHVYPPAIIIGDGAAIAALNLLRHCWLRDGAVWQKKKKKQTGYGAKSEKRLAK